MSITTAPTSAKTAEPTTATTNTNAAENTTASKQYLKLAGLILGLSTILLLMLLSFVTPLLNSGAKDLPLAVGGPDMVTTKITQGLEAKSPDAFAVTSYSTTEEATEAVRNRDAIGAITAGPDGITIVTASAAGTPYSTILKQIGEGLSQTGQPIHYTDIAPLTAKDPSGSAISMLALPMIFGGMSSAVAFSTMFKKSRRKQIIGAIGVAILGGIIASATLYFGFGAFEANFWPTTAVIMLGEDHGTLCCGKHRRDFPHRFGPEFPAWARGHRPGRRPDAVRRQPAVRPGHRRRLAAQPVGHTRPIPAAWGRRHRHSFLRVFRRRRHGQTRHHSGVLDRGWSRVSCRRRVAGSSISFTTPDSARFAANTGETSAQRT